MRPSRRIRPRFTTLSANCFLGGNAQKIIVARGLSRNPRLLIAAQPTRSINISTTEFVHEQIVRAKDRGVGGTPGQRRPGGNYGPVGSYPDDVRRADCGRAARQEATEEKLGAAVVAAPLQKAR